MNQRHKQLVILALASLSAPLAHAYIGPGAGLSALGSVLALVGAFLLMILGFLWYPIKKLLRRRRNRAEDAERRSGNSDRRTSAQQRGDDEQDNADRQARHRRSDPERDS